MPCVGRKYRKQGSFYGFNIGFINISIDRTQKIFFFNISSLAVLLLHAVARIYLYYYVFACK